MISTAVPNTQINISEFEAWGFGQDFKRIEDEVDQYLDVPVIKVEENQSFDRLEWWKGNEQVYPTLARMAFDLLSIPAMSVEPERVFSG